MNITEDTLTVNLADNGSGMAFADAYCYDNDLNYVDLGYAVGTGTAEFKIDLSKVPEGVNLVFVDAMDYATNYPNFSINLTTGEVSVNKYNYGTVQYAADKLFNENAMGIELPIEGIVTEIYKDIVYIQSMNPSLDDPGYGFAIDLKDKEAINNIAIGDVWFFNGELDNYYGCPTLQNAVPVICEYKNTGIEEDNSDPGAELLYIPYTIFDLSAILDNPSRFAGEVFFFDELQIIGITEIGDGTRTIAVTDGNSCIDIVATHAGEGAEVGGNVFVVGTIVFDMGTPQIRPLCDESMFWIETY